MKKILLTSACTFAIIGLSGAAAHAGQGNDEMAQMREQIKVLMQEVARLKGDANQNEVLAQEVQTLKSQQKQSELEKQALADQIDEIQAQSSAAIRPAAGVSSGGGFSLNPGPTFTSADGRTEFAIGGKVHVESSFFDDDATDNPDGTEIRRAQIVVKGKIEEDWFFAFENEFAGNDSTVTDAFLGYSGLKNTEVKIGSFKEPFSSDFLTSDESNVFIEFAPLNAFTPERSIGIGASTHGEHWSASAGGFG